MRRDIPKYMDMCRRSLIKLDALLTNRFKLDDSQAALDDSERGVLKNVVICNEK